MDVTLRLTSVLCLLTASVVIHCGTDDVAEDSSTGSGASSATSTGGGTNTGGSNTGGSNTGGTSTGGTSTGGSNTGGSNTGGSNAGGAGGAPGGQGGQAGGAGGAGGNPWANRPVGQCVEDADCPDTGPSGAMCNRTAPGGICLACGASDANCPASAECNQFGSCSISCTVADECPPGQTCSVTGLCRIESCAAGVCPVPWFGCNGSNLCVRLPCDAGQTCPADTTCTDGLCIENHAL